jgi:hypothetical protein
MDELLKLINYYFCFAFTININKQIELTINKEYNYYYIV